MKMEKLSLQKILKENEYPECGIVVEKTKSEKAVIAYFVMEQMKQEKKVLIANGDNIELKLHGNLVYTPIRVIGSRIIIGNGKQTDTIEEGVLNGLSFEQALRKKRGEACLPCISSLIEVAEGRCSYNMSLIRNREDDLVSRCRYTFSYDYPKAGEGYFLCMYQEENGLIKDFEGEPKRIEIEDEDAEFFAEKLWSSLNADKKVALAVKYVDIARGTFETKIKNKY